MPDLVRAVSRQRITGSASRIHERRRVHAVLDRVSMLPTKVEPTGAIANETDVAVRAQLEQRCPPRQVGNTRRMEIGTAPPAEFPCALADTPADFRQCG